MAVNGTSIATFGIQAVPLCLGEQTFQFSFIMADVTQPILGADFLHANSLLVDVKGCHLVNAETFTSFRCFPSADTAPGVSAIHLRGNMYDDLLASRPKLTTPTFTCPMPAHGVEHFIQTRGPPIHSKAQRLSPEKRIIAEKEFRDMEAMGIIRRSNSPWSSPLHVVPKVDGGWRPLETTGVSMMPQCLIITRSPTSRTFLHVWPGQ